MDAKYYCESMQNELTGMKAHIYNIIREIDKMPDSDRELMWKEVPDLFKVVDDISARLDELRTECPSDYTTQKEGIDNRAHDLRKQIDYWDAERVPSGYFGG